MKTMRGLTLIELMIVVAIIGVLVSVALPIYDEYIATSRSAVARINAETLALAEQNYFFEFGAYLAGTYDPSGIDNLRGSLGWNPEDDGEFVYQVHLPACPAGMTNCFTITVTGFDGHTVRQLDYARP